MSSDHAVTERNKAGNSKTATLKAIREALTKEYPMEPPAEIDSVIIKLSAKKILTL